MQATQTSDSLVAVFRNPRIQLLVSLLSALGIILGTRSLDPDLFARISVGRLLDILGVVPSQDPFAFSPKKPLWIDHEWLFGLLIFRIIQSGGVFGLFAAKILFTLSSVWLISSAQRSFRSNSRPSLVPGAWLLVCVVFTTPVWFSTLRSQALTYLALPALLLILANYYRHKKSFGLWLLPPLFLAWANCHGGFVSGLGLFFLFVLGSTFENRKMDLGLAASLLLSALVTGISPYGARQYWGYILEAVTMPRPSITEWWPLDLFSGQAIFPLLVLATLVFGAIPSIRTRKPTALLLCLAAAFFGYQHVRLLPIFFIVAASFGVDFVETAAARYRGDLTIPVSRVFTVFLVGLVVWGSVAIGQFFYQLKTFELETSGYPFAATDWLAKCGKGGRLAVDFNSGSFAIHQLYPKYKISLDGRYEELYPESTVALVSQALGLPSAAQRLALAELAPDYLLLVPGVEAEQFSEPWKRVFKDKSSAVFSRFADDRTDCRAELSAKGNYLLPRF